MAGEKGGGSGGRGRAGQMGRNEILPGGGAKLIKCIDPNEGEALRRGSTFKPGGLAPAVPPPMGAGGRILAYN